MLIDHFYSDPHFHHENIIKYADRPFANVEEMNAVLIQRYNDAVSPEQTVLWLGDCAMPMGRFPEILNKLNGSKILVLGNHDKSESTMARLGFDLVLDRVYLHIEDRSCLCIHYPYADQEHAKGKDVRYLERRPKRVKGQVLIHGHTHSKKKRDGNSIHVGVDAWYYRPVTINQVRELVRKV